MRKKTKAKTIKRNRTKSKPTKKNKMIKNKTNQFYEDIEKDKDRLAIKPGRRTSRRGNIYYEYRINRSDKDPKIKL